MIDYLGEECSKCQSKDKLQIDHIDHATKEFDISKNWAISWERLTPELDKCQLLCKDCHLDKSKQEGSLAKGSTNERQFKHGTVNEYSK